MTVEAELHDGRILEFPDGTDPAVVQSTVKRVMGLSSAPEQPKMGMGEDIARSAYSGLQKGVAGFLGAPTEIWRLLDRGYQNGITRGAAALGLLSEEDAAKLREPIPGEEYKYGYDYFLNKIQGASLPEHQPQTTAGKYAGTIAEFAPGAVGVGANAAREIPAALLKYGAIPGATSETAGQLTEGTKAEPYARAIGGLVGTLPGLALDMRSTPKAVLGDATRGLSETDLRAAQTLMQEARQAGSPLSLPEAVQHVTNGATRLGDIARVVEQSSGGGPIMKQFYAGRPQANEAMAAKAFNASLGPQAANPYAVAPEVQKVAATDLTRTRQAINKTAEKYYTASRNATVAAPDFATLQQNPAFQVALRDIRGDEILGATVKGLPDNSVGVLDAVKKRLDAMRSSAADASKPNNQLVAELQKGIEATRDTATAASPEYRTALRIGQAGREKILGPKEQGPIGQLAEAESFDKQKGILFNPNPLPNSEMAIGGAVKTIAKANPDLAKNLVRMKVEQTFNEATQSLRSGPNQFGGAGFAAVLQGNKQQAKNLEAAIRALPDGNVRWQTFRKTLDILEAQGTRQPAGSQTDFNRLINQSLRGGSGVGEAVTTVASPSKAAGWVDRVYGEFRYGQNTEALARLFTDDAALPALKRILMMPTSSDKAKTAIAALLIPHLAESQRSLPSPATPQPVGNP